MSRASGKLVDPAEAWNQDGIFGNCVAAAAVRNLSPSDDLVVADHVILDIQLGRVNLFGETSHFRTQSSPSQAEEELLIVARPIG